MAEKSKEKSDKREFLKEYLEEVGGMTNWMIKVPTYDQWLAMKEKNINFKKYSNI